MVNELHLKIFIMRDFIEAILHCINQTINEKLLMLMQIFNCIFFKQYIGLQLQTHQSGQGKFLPWLILKKNSMPLTTTLQMLQVSQFFQRHKTLQLFIVFSILKRMKKLPMLHTPTRMTNVLVLVLNISKRMKRNLPMLHMPKRMKSVLILNMFKRMTKTWECCTRQRG